MGLQLYQKNLLEKLKESLGAGNVVDAEGFRFLAECGADFVKIGIGGGSGQQERGRNDEGS